MKLATFKVDEESWSEFQSKYRNSSEMLRRYIDKAIGKNNRDNRIIRGNWKKLLETLDNSVSLVVYGNVGSGKTSLMKDVIENDTTHKYLVIDTHNEYLHLPSVQNIQHVQESSRLPIDPHPDISKMLFVSYYNQILSTKWDENTIIVIEEAHRYKSFVKKLLQECRKFVKIVVVSQIPLTNIVPTAEVVIQ